MVPKFLICSITIFICLITLILSKISSASNVNTRDVNDNTFIKVTDLSCFAKQEYVKNIICQLKPTDAYNTMASGEMVLARNFTVEDKPQLSFKTFVKYNGWQPWIFSYRNLNLCRLIDLSIKKPIYIEMVLINLIQYTNIYHKCPYMTDEHLWARNVSLEGLQKSFNLRKTYFPIGFYRADVNVTVNGKLAGSGYGVLQVGEKLKSCKNCTRTKKLIS